MLYFSIERTEAICNHRKWFVFDWQPMHNHKSCHACIFRSQITENKLLAQMWTDRQQEFTGEVKQSLVSLAR